MNDNRIKQLGEMIRIMKRTENELDSKQVLSVIERYSNALDLLDSYDHQNMVRQKEIKLYTFLVMKNVCKSFKVCALAMSQICLEKKRTIFCN